MNKMLYLYKMVHFRGFSAIPKIGLKNQLWLSDNSEVEYKYRTKISKDVSNPGNFVGEPPQIPANHHKWRHNHHLRWPNSFLNLYLFSFILIYIYYIFCFYLSSYYYYINIIILLTFIFVVDMFLFDFYCGWPFIIVDYWLVFVWLSFSAFWQGSVDKVFPSFCNLISPAIPEAEASSVPATTLPEAAIAAD